MPYRQAASSQEFAERPGRRRLRPPRHVNGHAQSLLVLRAYECSRVAMLRATPVFLKGVNRPIQHAMRAEMST